MSASASDDEAAGAPSEVVDGEGVATAGSMALPFDGTGSVPKSWIGERLVHSVWMSSSATPSASRASMNVVVSIITLSQARVPKCP